MTTAGALESLVRLGASVCITPERALTIRAPKGTLTPEFIATLRGGKEELLTALLTWDPPLAESLLRAVLARVATAYVPTWRRRFHEDAPRWLKVEARIEAAAMLHDMAGLIGALVEYQAFALQTFAAWSRQEEARQ